LLVTVPHVFVNVTVFPWSQIWPTDNRFIPKLGTYNALSSLIVSVSLQLGL
jgi:hypothetical protein